MADSEFTSGPVRDLTLRELGLSDITDIELLSDSGHNLVYRAMMDGKWIVLKVARVEEGNTTRNQLLLRREYDIMRTIDSIYVVQPWHLTEVDGLGMAIMMEYVRGRSLERFVAEKHSYVERRRIAEELMEALISLHDRQIIHGDLKPDNILITDAGDHVRLIDFGFSDTDAYVAKNIGTSPSIQPPHFSTPTLDETADVQRDIYAFGKILSLLFQDRFRIIIKRCMDSSYSSIREVRLAMHRHMWWQWLLFLLIIGLIAVLALVAWWRTRPQETFPIQQKDTIIIVSPVVEPQIDSAWLALKEQAEMKYNTLYRSYADSLKNMPEPERLAAQEIHTRYIIRMNRLRDQLVAANPEYEEQLTEQQLLIYTRDYPRLIDIYTDYPIVIRK